MAKREELKTVEIRRPDESHSWGICFAVLPDGPEILKVMNQSPAYGHLHSGQVIKTINGQSVGGLKREDINELLNVDHEVVILEVTNAIPDDPRSLLFGREYGRGSVEPRDLVGRSYRRNSELSTKSERRGSQACVEMPINLPNCRDEFERIHFQRKQSRELTVNQMESLRLQRAASVEAFEGYRRRGSAGYLKKPPGKPSVEENANEENNGMAGLRYMGVHIPSRTFKALATLVGMDPTGAKMDQQSVKPSSTEPCRTVIDVRAAAEAMRKESIRRASIDSNSSSVASLPPHPPSLPPPQTLLDNGVKAT